MNKVKETAAPMPGLLKRLSRVTTGGAYLPVIDGLRFVAILLVIVQHLSERVIRYAPTAVQQAAESSTAGWVAGRGTVGVFLFFTISGFILGLPFARRYREGRPAPALKAYLFRRLTRLEPPYILWMLVFTAILLFRAGHAPGELLSRLGASLLYCHNILFHEYSPINPVAWSLEVEVQFYLLAPLLAWFFFSVVPARSRRFVLAGSILLALLAQHLPGLKGMPWKASLVGQLEHFLLGFLLVGLYLDQKLRQAAKRAWLWDILGFIALIVMLNTWSEELIKEIAFSSALLLFFIAALKGQLLRAVLSRPWVAVIGGMCYTIYLIHLPLLELLCRYTSGWVVSEIYGIQLAWQFFLVSPILLGASILAFLLFEKPFMDPGWPKRLAAFRGRKALSLSPVKNILMSQNRINIIIAGLVLTSILSPFVLNAQSVNAQFPNLQVAYDESEELHLLQLQPLPALVDAAMANSPLLKIQDRKIENQAMDMMLMRREWMDNIGLGGSFSLGNGQFFNALQTPGDVSYQLTNRRNAVYNAGVTLKIPLGEIMSRPARLKQASNEIEIKVLERQSIEKELRTMVIEQYNHLSLQLRLLRIKTEAVEFMRAASESAEEYFREGAIAIEQYTQSVTKMIRAEEEFEQARSETLRSFLMLRELVGVNISLNPEINTPGQ